MMFHFKNDSLAWGKRSHRRLDLLANFLSQHALLGIGFNTLLLLAIEEIHGLAFIARTESYFGGLVFGAAPPLAEMIQTGVCDNAINPCVKTGLKTKAMEFAVDFEK